MSGAETASVHPSETYQSQTICYTAVTFGIGVLYKTLWSKSEFHQN